MNKEPTQNKVTKNQSQSLSMAISGVIILLGISVVFLLNSRNSTPEEIATTATTTNATLLVPAQVATDSVHNDQVTLPQAGFLAVRAIDNDRLGQIIEIGNTGYRFQTHFAVGGYHQLDRWLDSCGHRCIAVKIT